MTENPPLQEPIQSRKAFWQKTAFGAGSIPEGILNQGMQQFGNNVYAITFGLNPALVGLALAIPRIWDAIVDPIVGNWSDKLNTRWGRRKPLMLSGILLSAFAFSLAFFASPDWPDMVLFGFLITSAIIFFTTATMYCIPYIAMGYEYTDSYDERSRLMAFRTFLMPIGAFLMMWLFPLSQSGLFSNSVAGARWVAVGAGVVFVGFALLPILFVPNHNASHTKGAPRMKFLKSIISTLKNRAFIFALVPCVIVAMSLNYRSQFFLYVNVYCVFEGDLAKGSAYAATFYTISHIFAMFMAPVFAYVATHTSKKKAMYLALGLMMFGSLSTIFFMRPDMPYLALLPQLIVDPAIAGIFMLYHSMVADVCDLDELKTGLRREASYGAVAGWVYKTGSSLAILLSGMGLWLAGFDAELGEAQTSEFIYSSRMQFAFIPAAACFFGILLFRFYPITRQKAEEIRQQLEDRKATALNENENNDE